MGIIGADTPNGLSTSQSQFVTTGTVEVLPLDIANFEYTHTFPALTKRFSLKARYDALGVIKISYVTGGNYQSIPPGAVKEVDRIGAASLTIYLQSPKAGTIVELESWV